MDTREIARYALDALKAAGADEAWASAKKVRLDELNVLSGEMNLMRTVYTTDFALKAVKDQKKGVVMLNRAEKKDIEEAVKDAMAAAENAPADPCEGVSEMIRNASFTNEGSEGDMEALYDRMTEFLTDVKEKYPSVVIEEMTGKYYTEESTYQNSNGVDFHEEDGIYGFSVTFSAHEGEKASSFNYTGASFRKTDRPLLSIGMTEDLIRESTESLDAGSVDGKFTGTVVLTPASIGDLIGTICGNFLSDDALIEGTSIWKDKLGEKVASEEFSLTIDPEGPGVVSPYRFTVDGYLIERLPLIEKGVLKNFMLSRYGAKKTGGKRTFSDSSNLLVSPGEKSLEEIIGGIERGVYVERLSGGAPSANGDLTAVAKNSFLIENGRIGKSLNETMLSFNVADAIQNVVGISRETRSDGSGDEPWIAFDGATVSGK